MRDDDHAFGRQEALQVEQIAEAYWRLRLLRRDDDGENRRGWSRSKAISSSRRLTASSLPAPRFLVRQQALEALGFEAQSVVVPPPHTPSLIFNNNPPILGNFQLTMTRFREALGQELVKRRQVLQPPVLAGAHLAQVAAQIDEVDVPLALLFLLPDKNLVEL